MKIGQVICFDIETKKYKLHEVEVLSERVVGGHHFFCWKREMDDSSSNPLLHRLSILDWHGACFQVVHTATAHPAASESSYWHHTEEAAWANLEYFLSRKPMKIDEARELLERSGIEPKGCLVEEEASK